MSKLKTGLVKLYLQKQELKKESEQLELNVSNESNISSDIEDEPVQELSQSRNEYTEVLDTNKKLIEQIALLEKDKRDIKQQLKDLQMKSYIQIQALEKDLQQANETIALLRREIEEKRTHQRFLLDARRYDIKTEDVIKMKKEGLSNYKIAKILNCSEGTVRNRLNNKF